MKKVAFFTLGCKVNQIETEHMKENFLHKGYSIVDFSDEADIYVINTCTVTHVSDRKSRAMVRRAVRKNPQAMVVATGCLAQVDAEQLAAINGITLVLGNRQKENLAEIIESFLDSCKQGTEIICDPIKGEDKLKPIIYSQQHKRTRAFVKIQDGCQSFCSYCIVPYTRGPVRSKLAENVCLEIEQLLKLGYREIVLSGIHTGLYGSDLKQGNLAALLNSILKQFDGDYRIRMGSLEALEVSNEIIDLVASEERLCRHFHIPLQSGSDKILQAMNRRYDGNYYYELIKKIDRKIPGAAFTADVMVGFPMEDDKDFMNTYRLLKELPISDLHVFKYSKRPGTKAAHLSPQVSEKEKQARSEELIQLGQAKRRGFMEGFLHQELRVLVERSLGANRYLSLSDNYMEIELSSEKDITGEFARIIPKSINNDKLDGLVVG